MGHNQVTFESCMLLYRHMSLVGNSLHCEGASELVTALATVCEGVDEQTKPPLSRLHLQDNGIDVLGERGLVETVVFTRMLKRFREILAIFDILCPGN